MKYYRILDIITPQSQKSACFTKGYAQRYEGTGSYLEIPQVREFDFVCNIQETKSDVDPSQFPKLRAFHSKEIAKLLCFPDDFCKELFCNTTLSIVCITTKLLLFMRRFSRFDYRKTEEKTPWQ